MGIARNGAVIRSRNAEQFGIGFYGSPAGVVEKTRAPMMALDPLYSSLDASGLQHMLLVCMRERERKKEGKRERPRPSHRQGGRERLRARARQRAREQERERLLCFCVSCVFFCVTCVFFSHHFDCETARLCAQIAKIETYLTSKET